MSQIIVCDGPDCDERHPGTPDAKWYVASLQVHLPTPTAPEDQDPGDPDELGWHWHSEGQRIDACSLEHLRSALAVKIAELTDEPACP